MKISLVFALLCCLVICHGAPAPIFPLVYGAAIPAVVLNGGLATNAALLGLYKLGVAGVAASQLQGEETEESGYPSNKRVRLFNNNFRAKNLILFYSRSWEAHKDFAFINKILCIAICYFLVSCWINWVKKVASCLAKNGHLAIFCLKKPFVLDFLMLIKANGFPFFFSKVNMFTF